MADIYEYGFDKDLNRPNETNFTGVVYDTIENAFNSSQLLSGGSLTLKSLTISGLVKQVAPGDDINAAIDAVSREGGGTVQFLSKTYTLTSNLNLRSNVVLAGAGQSATTIDFNSAAFGINAVGSNAYSSGTVTVTNNGTTVNGSSTSWLANVSVGQSILLSGLWYPIAAVSGDTTMTISAPYAGPDLSGDSYIAATPINNIEIKDMLIKGSASSAVKAQYYNELFLRNLDIQTSLIGVDLDDGSNSEINEIDITACYYPYTFTNVHFISLVSSGAVDSLLGAGITMGGVTNSKFDGIFSLNNADEGMNITSCSNISFIGVVCSENSSEGFEFVSGNSDLKFINCGAEDNVADGMKLTATSDTFTILGGTFRDNGGYGINIAAATCDNNIISGNTFSGNSSGAVNDSGTGTIIRGNSGVDDNSAGTVPADVQSFTSNDTWTKPANADRVFVQMWGGGGSGGRLNTGGGPFHAGGGGGGGYVDAWFNPGDLGATEAVTIGAGGASKTSDGSGNVGGNTTFDILTAYGGGGGTTADGTTTNGGGGGGSLAAGGAGSNGKPGPAVSGAYGDPAVDSGIGGFGHISGGGGASNAAGGGSLYGGAGGGGGYTSGAASAGGDSIYGGDGGAGAIGGGNATAGTAPGGGGGGAVDGGNSGAGADGKVTITTYF